MAAAPPQRGFNAVFVDLVAHPLTREAVLFTQCRVMTAGLRLLLLRWALRQELARTGAVLPPLSFAALAVEIALSHLTATDTHLVTGILDTLAMKRWVSPSLVWFRVPTLREIDAEDVDPDELAQHMPQRPSARRAAAAQPTSESPQAGSQTDDNGGSPTTGGSPAAAAAAAGAADDAMVPPDPRTASTEANVTSTVNDITPEMLAQAAAANNAMQWRQRCRWWRHRAEVVAHALVSSTMAVGVRRVASVLTRSMSWAAVSGLVLRAEPLLKPSELPAVTHRLTVLGAGRWPVGGFRAGLLLRRAVLAGEDGSILRVLAAPLYASMLQHGATLLGLLWVTSGSASHMLPTLRRKVLRPLYRKRPWLRSPARSLEAFLKIAGPKIFYAVLATPGAMLKLRLFAAAFIGSPYPTVASAVPAVFCDRRLPLWSVGFVAAHITFGLVNEFDIVHHIATRLRSGAKGDDAADGGATQEQRRANGAGGAGAPAAQEPR